MATYDSTDFVRSTQSFARNLKDATLSTANQVRSDWKDTPHTIKSLIKGAGVGAAIGAAFDIFNAINR